MMRYLAIDYGLKRTGLAICDDGESIPSPLKVLTEPKLLIDSIVKIAKEEEVGAIVIGLPLNMDDASEGPMTKRVREFAGELERRIDLPIFFQDERLSSFDAEGKMAGLYTRKKKKGRLDAVAAASILQAFLDNKHNL
jgi:putative Holliday junction resolvase